MGARLTKKRPGRIRPSICATACQARLSGAARAVSLQARIAALRRGRTADTSFSAAQ